MGGFGIDWYIILTNKTVTELVRWLGDDCVFFLYWDFVLTCLWHVYEALCATRHKEDRWSWMFMTFILQQQDHYKVLGLEKLRHKATLGDIKKACKFVILGCNSFNQIFFSCGHARFFPKEPCVVTQMHELMNFNCAITLRVRWCKKEIFQLNRPLNFFLSCSRSSHQLFSMHLHSFFKLS